MKPIYLQEYINDYDNHVFNHLLNDLTWLEETSARKEYFMSTEPLSYTYGVDKFARTYISNPFSDYIESIRTILNSEYKCNYNVCFLNRYDTNQQQLGWHADDSPEMNPNHDIAVISFGYEREIWWKEKSFKGTIPPENRQLLHNGSLFIMPAGFQENHFHRIPKCDKQSATTRISLTFRNYKK